MNQHGRQYSVCGLVATLLAIGNGCALTSKADPVNIRYFDPERTPPSPTRGARSDSAGVNSPVSVRLGRVQSGHHLRERIIYQNSEYELGYHDDLRWLERPAVYAERAIVRALFERRATQRVLGASAPTLEVEVSAFYQVRTSKGDYAFVQLDARLSEVNAVIWQNTFSAREAAAGSDIEAVVAAMAGALEGAAESLAQGVSAALSGRSTSQALVQDH